MTAYKVLCTDSTNGDNTQITCRNFNFHRTTTHTLKKGLQWWRVELGATYHVNLVLIYNRLDNCCQTRINGAKVYAGSESCGFVRWVKNRHVYAVSCNGAKANYVKITLENEYLQLAEVQVFGKILSRGDLNTNESF